MASQTNRRQEEQEAVRTTIVGGRPPGCGKSTGSVPRGIEVLVKKAAVDPEFKALLLSNRGEAARSIGLELSPAESMMLSAAPVAQLEAIIAATNVPPSQVPAFRGRVATVMLAALGVVTVASICLPSLGSRPEGPPDPEDNAPVPTRPAAPADDQPLIIAGAVVVRPATQPATQPTEPIGPVAGIRPVSSPGIAGERIDRPPARSAEPATQPATSPPPRNITVFGLMIDRPQESVIRGIRVDTPRTAPTTNPTTNPAAESEPAPEPDFPIAIDGIRPDRPLPKPPPQESQ